MFANSIFFVQSGYSTYVLRQASRRSWRIGQKKPVRVVYLHYADTAQESCLRLMGKKMLVSLALEGKFVADGIQALEDDDDILTSMARELVTQRGVGERADAIWRELHARHVSAIARPEVAVEDQIPAKSDVDVFVPTPTEDIPSPLSPIETAEEASLQTLTLGAAIRRTVRRSPYRSEDQLSFGF